MRPKYYTTNNIVRMKKRTDYYEVYIDGLLKPFYINLEDKHLLRNHKLSYNGNYILADNVALHRRIKSGPVIHHINRNKLDNRRANLEICNSNSDHMSRHFNKTGEMSRSSFQLNQDQIDTLAELAEEQDYWSPIQI